MRKFKGKIVNDLGMTLVEILVSISLIALLTLVFVPFINGSLKGIIKAIEMHEILAEEKSNIDEGIVSFDIGIEDVGISVFPLLFHEGDLSFEAVPVNGFIIRGTEGVVTKNTLVTFVSGDVRFVSQPYGIQEGYFGNSDDSDDYDDYIDRSNGIHSDVDPNDVQDYIDEYGRPYIIPVDADKMHLTGNGEAHGFHPTIEIALDRNGVDVESVFNPPVGLLVDFAVTDKGEGMIMLIPGTYGLDNEHSPYTIEVEIINEKNGVEKHFGYYTFIVGVSLANYEAVGNNGIEELAINVDDWIYKISRGQATRLPSTVDFMDIIYGDMKYVTVGNNGSIWYNQDANNVIINPYDENTGWLEVYTGLYEFEFIEYINGLFLAGGESGTLMKSMDGINWFSAINWDEVTGDNLDYDLTGIAYDFNTGTYMVTLNNGDGEAGVMTTTSISDSDLWEDPIMITNFSEVKDLVYTGERFLLVGKDGEVAYTTDLGDSWTVFDVIKNVDPTSPPYDFYSIAINNGFSVFAGQNGVMFTHFEDLETPVFNVQDSGIEKNKNININDVEYTKDYFVAVGDKETIIYYDEDTMSWKPKSGRSVTSGTDTTKPVNLYGVIGRE